MSYVFPWEAEPTLEQSKKYRKLTRTDWDTYFMNFLPYIASRSPCLKKGVAAILVKDNRLIASGFNGPASGIPHCKSCIRSDKDLKNYDLCPSVHSEINCIAMCAKHGINAKDSTLYCNYFPCKNCLSALINAGVKKIVYKLPPVDEVSVPLAFRGGLSIEKWKGEFQK